MSKMNIIPKPAPPETLKAIANLSYFSIGEKIFYKDYQGEYFQLVDCHIQKESYNTLHSLLSTEDKGIVLLTPTSFNFTEK